jgi:hypothetical protein
MIDSLTSWRDTIDRKPGCRIPRYANFTPDLMGRLKEQFGPDLAGHFGMDSVAGVALAPPPGYEPPDFSRYYEGRDVPADMTLNEDGVGKTAAGFYHFFGFIHPLVGAETVADIEAYPLRDYVGWSDEGMAERVANLHRAGRFVAGRYCQMLWMGFRGILSVSRPLLGDYAASAGCSIPSLNLMPWKILTMSWWPLSLRQRLSASLASL